MDRRVRVFVSSTLEELAAERNAVRAAIERLRLTPVMFELGARAHPPRQLYTSYLCQSDVFLGLYGESYGWVGPGASISGLEDEYLLASDHPRLLYVKAPAPGRDPRLQRLIEQIWTTSGVSTAPFRDADELAARVADDLAVLLTERFRAQEAATGGHQVGLDPEPLPHPAGPLVGRIAERDRLVGLLTADEPRLVTLLGPGGIGKTRLALAVAEDAQPRMAAVTRLVRRLEGIPLAIELAAARLRLLPVDRPLRSPGEELDLGTGDIDVPDRQRTMRATIAWSYDLLDAEDKRLARCLSVLAPTWTLAAAEAVAGPGVLDGVGRLVDHSMITVHLEGTGEPRLRMLRTLRTFLAERLAETGEQPEAVQRLTDYALRLAQDAESGLGSGASRSWRARLDAEIDTVRAVLDLAVEQDDALLAVRIASALTWYWWSRGLLVEMLRRAETVAGLPSATTLAPDQAGVLLWCRGTIRIATGAVGDARPLVERLLADARARDDDRVLALALFSAALVADPDEAPGPRALLEDAARLFEE